MCRRPWQQEDDDDDGEKKEEDQEQDDDDDDAEEEAPTNVANKSKSKSKSKSKRSNKTVAVELELGLTAYANARAHFERKKKHAAGDIIHSVVRSLKKKNRKDFIHKLVYVRMFSFFGFNIRGGVKWVKVRKLRG